MSVCGCRAVFQKPSPLGKGSSARKTVRRTVFSENGPAGPGGRAKRGRMRSFTGWLRALIEAAAQGRSPEEPLPSASQTPSPGISDSMNGVPTGGDVAFAVRGISDAMNGVPTGGCDVAFAVHRISDAHICCLAGEFPGRCSLSGHHRVLKSIAREISAPEIPPKAVNTKFSIKRKSTSSAPDRASSPGGR